mmetsp:Transcript_24529/g.29730  ORF Transcript_24529/g.29730 Transcript_24529/m.29730 type:complete len:331 (-) Transcript_24529:47-1039(-)|eukprot:CAMPEP_0197846396 /NCGR_PEP_ID=MMETSP1438-20131217/3144_1 /TAXON_ID=1461541 /ORGANISM="Pterosperma sp., Strain CCMP1384" /LENGTH=330 /DNA_ID=CAMNT_0043458029 /DNA_START=144 /DNA_END=1136 /DNA_ORIENTATION=+
MGDTTQVVVSTQPPGAEPSNTAKPLKLGTSRSPCIPYPAITVIILALAVAAGIITWVILENAKTGTTSSDEDASLESQTSSTPDISSKVQPPSATPDSQPPLAPHQPPPSPAPVSSGSACTPTSQSEPCHLADYAQNPFGDVLFMRHALAPGGGDPSQFELNDCSTQRNLDEVGRKQASTVGAVLSEVFGTADMAMNRVIYTSQWCRCVDTASLIADALNSAGLEATPLGDGPVADEADVEFGIKEEWGLNSFYQPELGGFQREECVARIEDALIESLRRGRRERNGRLVQTLLVTHQVTVRAMTGTTVSSGRIVAYDTVSGKSRELTLE